MCCMLCSHRDVTSVCCGVQSDVWELLFHSHKHGQSFNTFMGRVGTSQCLSCCSSRTADVAAAAAAAAAAAVSSTMHPICVI